MAWSHGGCKLCDAPKTAPVRSVARTWMRTVSLALAGVKHKSKPAALAGGEFDHPKELHKLNQSVIATNKLLSESPLALKEAALRRTARHAASAGGLTVVSFCDGKGSLLGFLLRAGIRIRRYLSVEHDENCNRVCRTLYGAAWEKMEPSALRFFHDARELTIEKLRAVDCWPVHLLAGATPCQDLSACNVSGQGLAGPQSRLFIDFCDFCANLQKDNDGVALAIFAENVIPANKADEVEMTRRLGFPALHSEAAVFEAARRPRLLFSNVPFASVPSDTPNVLLQSCLNPGAVALAPKAGCIITGSISGKCDSLATAKQHSHRNRGRALVLCASHSTDVRGLVIPEICRALGQPHYEVDSSSGSESDKAALLGRSLAAGQVLHALRTFIDAVLRAQREAEERQEGEGEESCLTVTQSPLKAQWAQCDSCSKWRRLPAGESVPAGRWTCRESMAGMCEAAEEQVLSEAEDDWQ